MSRLTHLIRRLAQRKRSLSTNVDPVLDSHGRRSRKLLLALTQLPPKLIPNKAEWTADTELLLLIAQQIIAKKPSLIVELGSGVSTIVCARCLQMNGSGRLISLEHDQRFLDRTKSSLESAGLAAPVTLTLATLKPITLSGNSYSWYDLAGLDAIDREIDTLIVDGPPGPTCDNARYPAGPLLFPRLSRDAQVFVDDANRDEEVVIMDRYKEEFPSLKRYYINSRAGASLLVNEASSIPLLS